MLARRSAGRPTSLHDWLCGVARHQPQPATAHVAEPIVHMPATAPQPAPWSETPVAPAEVGGELLSMAIIIPNRNQPELLRRSVGFLDFVERSRDIPRNYR